MDGPRVYAVASGKGGVGKTTSAVNLGAAFAEAGRTVAVVDVDLGMANVGDVLAFEAETPTLHDVLSGDADLEAAIRGAPGEFDAVVGSAGMEAFGRADPAGLREVVETLRERYDVVVLDTGGGLSYDAALPLGLADSVILVATPDDAALNNAAMTRTIVDRIGGDVAGIIVNRSGAGSGESQEAIESRLDLPVLGSVPEDRTVAESVEAGIPVVVYDRDSPAAQSFREIAYGILEEPLPVDWGDQDQAGIGSGAAIGGAGGTGLGGPTAESSERDSAESAPDAGDEPSSGEPEQADSDIIVADADADPAADSDDEVEEGDADEAAGGTDEIASEPDDADDTDDSGGPGIADAIETAESDPDAVESGGLVGGPAAEDEEAIETGDDESDGATAGGDERDATTAGDDEDDSRSFLSKLTGGLFG